MTIDFECTKCGKCCHDLRLPLTVDESIAWLERGGDVQILCEAMPWPQEPPADNLQVAHKRRRSFATMSGSLPTRILVVLAASYVGPCPNLALDMRCGIYEQRPLVCRIYPAEISQYLPLTPAHKACPPEAWTPGLPALMRAGKLVDAATMAQIQQSRDADLNDVFVRQQVCALLGINQAAVSNEGFVAFSPDRGDLLAALRQAGGERPVPMLSPDWRFVSNRRTTVNELVSMGALSVCVEADSVDGVNAFEYLGFFPASV